MLAKSRPTAVNLFWALERMKKAKDLESEAKAIFDQDLVANRAMGKLGAELIPQGARVMTHCNTGALATAGHGTALGVIRSAKEKGVSVIACETRPYLQGARLTAWECVQEGIPCTLITDSMAGHLMSRGEVDMVLVGADRIAANGDVANKIGTYPLAVLARRHRIPFYVAAPLSTFDPDISDGSKIPIEERPASEVTGYRETRWAAEAYRCATRHSTSRPRSSSPGSSARKAWCSRPAGSASRASGPDRGRLQRHPARAPHQVELEVHEFLRAIGVRFRAHADEAVAQPALQRAETLPLQPVDRVSGRMRLRDGVSDELLAPVVVVALRTGKIELALPAIEGVSPFIKKRLGSLVDC